MKFSLLFLTIILAGQIWGQGRKEDGLVSEPAYRSGHKVEKWTTISEEEWRGKKREEHKHLEKTLKDESFEEFIKRIQQEFESFLDSINNEYADFLGKVWKPIHPGETAQILKYREKRPKTEESNCDDKIIEGEVIQIKTDYYIQPKPPKEIIENKETNTYNTFIFYGTPMKVRWGDAESFRFDSISNQNLAKAYKRFSDNTYKNLLFDCLSLRKEYDLCDWAYYKMLQAMTEQIWGKGTNEAVFLQGLLLGQSGYEIRFAKDSLEHHLFILCKLKEHINGYKNYKTDNGRIYYIMEKGVMADNLFFCPHPYKGEKEMSLKISILPKLKVQQSDKRIIHNRQRHFTISAQINKNLVAFFKDYPFPIFKKDITDNEWKPLWEYYANAPASDEMSKYVYESLREQLTGNEIQNVNTILSWVCPYDVTRIKEPPLNGRIGIPFIHDNQNSNHNQQNSTQDQPLFPDETLMRPGGDCEDHAILFSRLVRDLLELDVVLLWYNNHLAAAVHFNSNVSGVKVADDEGKLYCVCEPSIYDGQVGLIATKHNKETPIIIKVN